MVKRNIFAFSLAAALVALVVFFVLENLGKKHYNPSESKESEYLVTAETIRSNYIPQYEEYSGTVHSNLDAMLSPKIMSTVEAVYVREGDRVLQGQPIIRLESRDLEAMVAQASSALKAANTYASNAKIAAQLQKTQSSTSIASAEAALKAAKEQLLMAETGPRRQERAQAQLAVEQAEAQYRNAEADYRRMEQLYNEKALPKQRLDYSKTQFEVAKAAYNAAKQQAELVEEGTRSEEIRAARERVKQAEEALRLAKASAVQDKIREQEAAAALADAKRASASLKAAVVQKGYSIIRAPFNGVVTSRNVDPGDLVAPGQSLIRIEDNSEFRIEVNVPESLTARIHPGSQVDYRIDSFSSRWEKGYIKRIVPSADPNSRSFIVHVNVPSKNGIKSGMFGRIRFSVDNRLGILVPKKAVWERNGLVGVFIADKGHARMRLVKTGKEYGDKIDIISGLSDGNRVITSGIMNLRDGSRIRED